VSSPLLLDTCAALWISRNEPFSSQAKEALEQARDKQTTIFVSPITAWELGLLVARGRMNLQMPPERWFARLIEAPGVGLAELTPDILIASSFLPGSPPRDPADRILAATAREYEYRLVTRDGPLLEYGKLGHVEVLVC
jgi:PIN domain nuclease of toxin-antitoxin system